MTLRAKSRGVMHGLGSAWAMVIAFGVAASGATAGTTSLSFVSTTAGGHGSLGKYQGSMSWNSTAKQLTINIHVLATTAAGGKLTGIAFGGPVGAGVWSLVSVSSSHLNPNTPNTGFKLFGGVNPNSVNAMPFGGFNVGVGTGNNNWQGGTPNQWAIPADHTATFVFQLSGSGLPGDVSAFWQPGDFGFIARFQGFDNKDSDKSPAILQELTVVPVPAPVLLAGLGLIGAGVLRRRFSTR